MESGDMILHVCNVGNPPVSPLHCFASHSTLFQWKSLFSSQLSSAVLKVWGSCLAGVWVVFSLRQMPRYPLFYPPTLTLKHASFLRLRSISFPQVNFCCTFPFVSAPSPSSPPPPLPLCPRCSPRVVNLLSAGSMNRTGLELRPTHLPTIACALCMAPACQNHLSSISSITAAPVLLFPPPITWRCERITHLIIHSVIHCSLRELFYSVQICVNRSLSEFILSVWMQVSQVSACNL